MTNPGDSVGTNAAYGGRTSTKAFNDVLSAFSGRGILSGWGCVPGGGMALKLGGSNLARDVAIAENDTNQHTTINNRGGQPIDVLIEAAPSVGSRIDLIVAYVSNPPRASQANPLPDSPSTCGLIAVMGNVSNNPTIPGEAMIREAITADGASGANAFYVVLAKVAVGAGVTTLTANDITQGEKTTLGGGLIASGEIGAEQIANGAITSAKIGNAAVASHNIDWATMKLNPQFMQCGRGRATIKANNAGGGFETTTFPYPFRNPPCVTASLGSLGASASSLSISNITATGFKTLARQTASNDYGLCDFEWVAVDPTQPVFIPA